MGGRTRGSVTKAPTAARHFDCVCESHHANGVATNSKISVVAVASLRVRPIACQASKLIGRVGKGLGLSSGQEQIYLDGKAS